MFYIPHILHSTQERKLNIVGIVTFNKFMNKCALYMIVMKVKTRGPLLKNEPQFCICSLPNIKLCQAMIPEK